MFNQISLFSLCSLLSLQSPWHTFAKAFEKPVPLSLCSLSVFSPSVPLSLLSLLSLPSHTHTTIQGLRSSTFTQALGMHTDRGISLLSALCSLLSHTHHNTIPKLLLEKNRRDCAPMLFPNLPNNRTV